MLSATKNIKSISKIDKYGFQINPTCGKNKPKTMLRTTINNVKYLLIRALIRQWLPRKVNIALSGIFKINNCMVSSARASEIALASASFESDQTSGK